MNRRTERRALDRSVEIILVRLFGPKLRSRLAQSAILRKYSIKQIEEILFAGKLIGAFELKSGN